jgi:hypothetical protein
MEYGDRVSQWRGGGGKGNPAGEFPKTEHKRLMDSEVPLTGNDFIHFIFNMQFELLEVLLLKLVRARDMRLGFDFLYLVFQMRMLLG